jgi:predicted nucleic acid-binding protein
VIVVDASALVAGLVVSGETGTALRARLRDDQAHAPHLVDIEVMSALRRLVLTGDLPRERAERAVDRLRRWPVRRHPHRALLGRIHELRDTVTAYDAAYVALAEIIGATLVTCDGRLARSHGHRAAVEHHPV